MLLSEESLSALNNRISANADALIEMGVQEWYKTRRKRKPTKTQQDQLREIEDNKLCPEDVNRLS